MADRFATQITIGGTFTLTDQNAEAFDDFRSLLQELAPQWGETNHYIPDISDLDEAMKDGYIYGCDDDRSGGEFEDLEIACQALGLQYDRNHSPKYEYPGDFVAWRPGMESVHLCSCDDNGNRYLTESQINEVIINQLDDDSWFKEPLDRIINAKKEFEEMLNGGVAPLEPFVLTDARTVVTE